MEYCYTLKNLKKDKIIHYLSTGRLYEIRYDLNYIKLHEIKKILAISKNVVATYRPTDGISETERVQFLEESIRHNARLVDLEYDMTPDHFDYLSKLARIHGTNIIISYHQYSSTPMPTELHKVMNFCKSKDHDIIKIATYIEHPQDIASLMSVLSAGSNIICIGMGIKGSITRLLGIQMRSPLIYTYHGKNNQVAPGQISINEINKVLTTLNILS